MSDTFKVKVNNLEALDISKQEIENLDVLRTNESQYHLIYQNKSYTTEISEANFNEKSYVVKVNNNEYHVDIADELDQLIQQMGFSLSASKNVDNIKAPMPGLILDIAVVPGQTVKEDDPLLILEAMKMENSITSPRDGVIKSVLIKKSDAVEKNQLLIEFE